MTAPKNLTFGLIKWTPEVALAGSFLDIVFGQYFRQGMGKKLITKIHNESIVASFARKYFPWSHVHFLINEILECEIKVSLGYYSVFY